MDIIGGSVPSGGGHLYRQVLDSKGLLLISESQLKRAMLLSELHKQVLRSFGAYSFR